MELGIIIGILGIIIGGGITRFYAKHYAYKTMIIKPKRAIKDDLKIIINFEKDFDKIKYYPAIIRDEKDLADKILSNLNELNNFREINDKETNDFENLIRKFI